jgi:acetyltransferase-like isoleucine patch superfamily enzyme
VATLKRLLARILQAAAMVLPGGATARVWLHRRRGVRIGERVFIGMAAIIETDRPDLVSIGNDVIIGIRVTIIAHFKGTFGVTIGDEVFIGPGVVILPGVEIGNGAVVTAGSVVTKSIRERTVVQGNPAREVARCEVPLTEGIDYEEFQAGLRTR